MHEKPEQPAILADDFLRQVGRLQKLTQLKLREVPLSSDMQLLPIQLQQLKLKYKYPVTGGRRSSRRPIYSGSLDSESDVDEPGLEDSAAVSLQHLTCLRHSELEADQLGFNLSMPPSLEYVKMKARFLSGALADQGSLLHLTSLKLDTGCILSKDIRALYQCQKLDHCSLKLDAHWLHKEDLLEVAAAWHDLPLRALTVLVPSFRRLSSVDAEQLMKHVAAASQLTALQVHLDLGDIDNIQPELQELNGFVAPQLVFCEHLKALQDLKTLHLRIKGSHAGVFAEQDAQHLSALEGLTSLELCTSEHNPYTVAATLCLLAKHLTELKRMAIYTGSPGYHAHHHHQVGSLAALPEVGRLSTLEALRLDSLPQKDAREGLQMLTGLSKLTSLGGFKSAGHKAVDDFWSAIEAQNSETSEANLGSDSPQRSDSNSKHSKSDSDY